MKIIKIAILLTALILMFSSCKNNLMPIEVGTSDPNYPPGRRDYTWTADTIKAYLIFFNSIWGKSINDIWAVSSVGSVYENIYRFNGNNWYKETRIPIGNTISLWGTEQNLWICCGDGRIWNYNNVFTSSKQFTYEGTNVLFFSMAGKYDNEVYAGGGKNISNNKDALIYKYDGSGWQNSKIIKNFGNVFWVKYSSKTDCYYFLTSVANLNAQDTVRLLEYNKTDIKLIFKGPDNDEKRCTMNNIDGFLYVRIGTKLYRYINGKLNDFLEINLPNFGGQLWGRNKDDFFIRMQDGLLHYNGSDLQYIIKFPTNTTFGTSALILDKDIFLHAFDNNTGYNIIYHGKLK